MLPVILGVDEEESEVEEAHAVLGGMISRRIKIILLKQIVTDSKGVARQSGLEHTGQQ